MVSRRLFLIASLTSIIAINRGRFKFGIVGLFGTCIITVSCLLYVLVPKIDKYTQSSLFNFYEQNASTHYFQPLGMHSYAHLFYGKQTPLPIDTDDEPKWMVLDKVDKPVYFIVRAHDLERTLEYFPHLKETDRKGGYVILERTDENYPFLGSP